MLTTLSRLGSATLGGPANARDTLARTCKDLKHKACLKQGYSATTHNAPNCKAEQACFKQGN